MKILNTPNQGNANQKLTPFRRAFSKKTRDKCC